MRVIKRFENFEIGDPIKAGRLVKYHVYQHPMSTSVIFYCIPENSMPEILSNKNYVIGPYHTNFNDYLSKGYIIDRGVHRVKDIESKAYPIESYQQNINGKTLYYELPYDEITVAIPSINLEDAKKI